MSPEFRVIGKPQQRLDAFSLAGDLVQHGLPLPVLRLALLSRQHDTVLAERSAALDDPLLVQDTKGFDAGIDVQSLRDVHGKVHEVRHDEVGEVGRAHGDDQLRQVASDDDGCNHHGVTKQLHTPSKHAHNSATHT